MKRREAATVLLHRGSGTDLEVYLGERARELRFFGGYHALPGGVRSGEDGEDRDEALQRCAAREIFEETGVLLLEGVTASTDERERIRRGLLAEDGDGWAALRERAERPTELKPICRMLTPPFAPVRYDTEFFAAELPDGEQPEIWPGELVSGRFWNPADALAAWRRGEVLIVPPVVILLELLVDRDLPEFLSAAQQLASQYDSGKLHRVQFSPGIILASLETPTLPPATTTNCLMVGHDSLYIVDPATPHEHEQRRLFELLDELRDEGRELSAVLLTHHHPDHVAAAPAVCERYGIPVRGHELTLSRLGFPRSGQPINDGDRLPLGAAPDGSDGWELEAIFTPGHDQGHLCYRESRYGALVAGDMLSTVSTIVIDPPEGHMQTYLASLDRLLRVPMTTLYPAHGPAHPNGHALIQHFIKHRRDRQDRVVEALGKGPATVDQLVGSVYADVDEAMHPVAARSLLAGLQWLQETGAATEADGVWTACGTDQP